VTWFLRFAVILGPIIGFWVTRRSAISLQRADEERLLHGLETGVIMRSPDGKYTEKHQPISTYEAYSLTARDRVVPHEIGQETDDNGVRAPRRALHKVRAALSRFYYADAVQKPTRQEIEEAHERAHDADADEIQELTEDTETYREVTSEAGGRDD
jgi:ubiquinol-cytochrome c reductase cytochrome b subunit